jgi:hypothetical protein
MAAGRAKIKAREKPGINYPFPVYVPMVRGEGAGLAPPELRMPITRIFLRGIILILVSAIAIGTAAAAQATSKKTKHAKSPPANSASTPGAAQPAVPGPPDPGVYK